MGWGFTPLPDLIGENLINLKNQLINWINAEEIFYDIWDIELEVNDQGYFTIIKNIGNKRTKVIMKEDEGGNIVKVLNK